MTRIFYSLSYFLLPCRPVGRAVHRRRVLLVPARPSVGVLDGFAEPRAFIFDHGQLIGFDTILYTRYQPAKPHILLNDHALILDGLAG